MIEAQEVLSRIWTDLLARLVTLDAVWALDNINAANTYGVSLAGNGLLSDAPGKENQVTLRAQVQLKTSSCVSSLIFSRLILPVLFAASNAGAAPRCRPRDCASSSSWAPPPRRS